MTALSSAPGRQNGCLACCISDAYAAARTAGAQSRLCQPVRVAAQLPN